MSIKKIDRDFLYKKNRLQQIKGFYYTAKFCSVSEAARVTNLTQSTITLQIQSLERDLGLKLFARDKKPLSLTEDGKEFYGMACPLMHEFDSVIEKFLNRKTQEDQEKLDIAVHHVAISYMIPQVVANFKKLRPDAKITVRNISPSDALKRLKDKKIDLVIYPNFTPDPEVEFINISSYDPLLIMSKKHPLRKRKIKNLRDLKDYDLIRIDRGLITLPMFEEAVKVHGIPGSVDFENGNWEILKHFVAENDFVAVVSEICIDKNDNFEVKNLSKFFPKMKYSVIFRKGEILRPIVKDFIKSVSKTIRNKA